MTTPTLQQQQQRRRLQGPSDAKAGAAPAVLPLTMAKVMRVDKNGNNVAVGGSGGGGGFLSCPASLPACPSATRAHAHQHTLPLSSASVP
jgi:hypothetical protein